MCRGGGVWVMQGRGLWGKRWRTAEMQTPRDSSCTDVGREGGGRYQATQM